jgi:Cu-Zn family superoxide dismutase
MKVGVMLMAGLMAVSVARADSLTEPAAVQKAVATLAPASASNVAGSVSFSKVDGGVKVVADLTGLKPGEHGFHVHEFGDCSAPDAKSAGGHFNPHKMDHGGPDASPRHAGDLGNIVADDAGKAHYERVDKLIALDGPDSIIGHSVIVHEKADDLKTQPTGNAGARVACGVINAVKP